MEHPGLDSSKIKEDHTIQQVQEKVKQIYERLSYAYSTNNQDLVNQLEMVKETYLRVYAEMIDEELDGFADGEIGNKIDIS